MRCGLIPLDEHAGVWVSVSLILRVPMELADNREIFSLKLLDSEIDDIRAP